MPHVCLIVHPGVCEQEAWQQADEKGVFHLCSVKDEETLAIHLFGEVAPCASVDALSRALCGFGLLTTVASPCIDWEEQWQSFAAGFQGGFVHLDLCDYGTPGKTLRLKPGPGFGDLSHPTTRMMLKLLVPRVRGKTVWDVGCGSGVLSLAAARAEAASVIGVDIEPLAVAHSQLNAEINDLKERALFVLPEELHATAANPDLLLMNMIPQEQAFAWERFPPGFAPKEAVVSGVLCANRDRYLAQLGGRLGRLVEEQEEEGWLAFRFAV